ncbi:MAG TPA: histidine kinase, partial [Chitinophagaceae bacterium]|nr:histidine kinase [Chitinophagaceae bacterium]
KNFIWIATDKGVIRYDGNKMQNFDLPDNVVFKIREDNKGRIWFFSHTGRLAYFFNGKIYPYRFNNIILQKTEKLLIIDAYVDDDDNVFMNSAPYSYKVSRSGNIEKLAFFIPGLSDTFKLNITQIGRFSFFPRLSGVDMFKQKTLFISRHDDRGIVNYKLDFNLRLYGHYGCTAASNDDIFFFVSNTIMKLKRDGSVIIKELPASAICLNAEPDGTVWVGLMRSGALLLDSNLNELVRVPFLEHKSVSSITRDYEGGLWFSTLEKGVYYLKNTGIHYLSGNPSLAQEIFRMYPENDSMLLYANAQGVYRLHHSTITPLLIQKNIHVSDLFMDDKKIIYLGGDMTLGFSPYLKARKIKNAYLFLSTSEIIRNDKKRLTWNHGGYLFELDLSAHSPQSNFPGGGFDANIACAFKPGIMFNDSDKQIWVGTINGLYKYLPARDYVASFKESFPLFKQGITCMRQLDNGIYTIGIRFGGITLMKDTTIIGTITESDGLLNNSIKYLLPLKDQLWVATAKGVSVIQFQSYQPLQYTITNIGKNEGFHNMIINQLTPFRGNIAAATSNGIYIIERPQEFLTKQKLPIPFYIHTVSYYKGDTTGVSHISVPFDKSRVVIKYSALSFNSPREVKYYYRLGNNDTTWQTINSTELVLENLSPGDYKVEIKAMITGQQRSAAVQTLYVFVAKPWWQNNWIRLGVLLLLGSGVYWFYKKRINKIKLQERQKQAVKTEMVEMEQKLLRSQMNPHFIFNSLTAIQQLIIAGNHHDANEYLVKFARLIRKTLELSVRPFIKLEEEKEYLIEYLVLEQYRIPVQFEFIVSIDPAIDPDKTEIPNMMLQPIIENCVRHGIKHLENKKGIITMQVEKKDRYLHCVITDNGIGRNENGQGGVYNYADHKSYGLDIVQKRLEILLPGMPPEKLITITDLPATGGSGPGTQVTLRLPFKIIKP